MALHGPLGQPRIPTDGPRSPTETDCSYRLEAERLRSTPPLTGSHGSRRTLQIYPITPLLSDVRFTSPLLPRVRSIRWPHRSMAKTGFCARLHLPASGALSPS